MKTDTLTTALATLFALCPIGCDLPQASFAGGGTWGTVVGAGDEGDSGSAAASEEPGHEVGELRVAIDAEPTSEVDEVWIRVDQVRARHVEQGWAIVSDDDVTFDLLALEDGIEQELGLDEVPLGDYAGLAVRVRGAWVVVDGERFPLEIPGADRNGLMIPFRFSVPDCSTLDIGLHWDVAAGFSHHGRYHLEPSIRVQSAAFSGECGAAGGGGTGGTGADDATSGGEDPGFEDPGGSDSGTDSGSDDSSIQT